MFIRIYFCPPYSLGSPGLHHERTISVMMLENAGHAKPMALGSFSCALVSTRAVKGTSVGSATVTAAMGLDGMAA